MASMLAVRLHSTKPEDLSVVEAPIPEPGPGEVRLRPVRTGICGSDLSAFLGKRNFDWVQRPRILGHEFSAEVDALGDGVSGLAVGDAVTTVAMQSCGVCARCRGGDTNLCEGRQIIGFHFDGAMAGRVVCPARYVMPIRYGLSHLEASLIEPLSVASRCVVRNTPMVPGDRVLVTGPGIIGMLCALLARSRGADVIVAGIEADREVRLAMAEELGFETLTVPADGTLATALEDRVDVLVEASGAPVALTQAPPCVRYGGIVSVIATYGQDVTLDMTQMVRSEQRVITTMGSHWGDFERAQMHLRDALIPVHQLTEEFPLSKALEAFEASRDKKVQKAVLAID